MATQHSPLSDTRLILKPLSPTRMERRHRKNPTEDISANCQDLVQGVMYLKANNTLVGYRVVKLQKLELSMTANNIMYFEV